ncbi:MAG: response regulator [Deltaproteobacteria bacterium]|nr:response regulator [Deltaproteobacteria bacterium]
MTNTREKPLLLIADDDPELTGILLKRLQSIECDIITATDGEKALEQVHEQRPDVVILDVMMPRKNGWEVCKAIRQDPETVRTGVIMLTGIGSSLNEMTSPLYGADEYLDKPFNFSELIFKIKRMLSNRR